MIIIEDQRLIELMHKYGFSAPDMSISEFVQDECRAASMKYDFSNKSKKGGIFSIFSRK